MPLEGCPSLRGDWSRAVAELEQACRDLAIDGQLVAGHAWYELGELRRLQGASGVEDAYQQSIACGRVAQPGLALYRLSQGTCRRRTPERRWALSGSGVAVAGGAMPSPAAARRRDARPSTLRRKRHAAHLPPFQKVLHTAHLDADMGSVVPRKRPTLNDLPTPHARALGSRG